LFANDIRNDGTPALKALLILFIFSLVISFRAVPMEPFQLNSSAYAKENSNKIIFIYAIDSINVFTIYDFVDAYLRFSDPEWDGEPLEPELPEKVRSAREARIAEDHQRQRKPGDGADQE
jgi:hypothetical protein